MSVEVNLFIYQSIYIPTLACFGRKQIQLQETIPTANIDN